MYHKIPISYGYNKFNPSSLSNLITFQDVQTYSSLTFSSGSGDGGTVSTWKDYSNNGNNFTRNSSSSNNFLYKASGMHNKPALYKNGTRVCFDSTNLSMYSSTVTQIIFFSIPTTATQLTGMIAGLFKSTAYMQITTNSTPSYFRIESSATNSSLTQWGRTSDVLMLAIRIQNSSTANFSNGINNNTFDPGSYTANGGARIGSLSPTTISPETEFYGHLLFNRSITDTELNKIYDWGQTRYGKLSTLSTYVDNLYVDEEYVI